MAYLWHFLFFFRVLYSVFTDTIVLVGDLLILPLCCCGNFFLLLFLKIPIQEPWGVFGWSVCWYFLLLALYWCFDISSVEIFSHLVVLQGFTKPESKLAAAIFVKCKLRTNNWDHDVIFTLTPASFLLDPREPGSHPVRCEQACYYSTTEYLVSSDNSRHGRVCSPAVPGAPGVASSQNINKSRHIFSVNTNLGWKWGLWSAS